MNAQDPIDQYLVPFSPPLLHAVTLAIHGGSELSIGRSVGYGGINLTLMVGAGFMTAEIAILNKSAVALATDSAVTISAQDKALKIFDTADKLFELSVKQPIGIMVYNGMQFLGMPFEAIVKEFRLAENNFDKVTDAANHFLNHLNELVVSAPEDEIERGIIVRISPIIDEIKDVIQNKLVEKISQLSDSADKTPDMDEILKSVTEEVVTLSEKRIQDFGKGRFLKRLNGTRTEKTDTSFIRNYVDKRMPGMSSNHRRRIAEVCKGFLKSSRISGNKTGLIFAGFGKSERFPTLISYEIDGVFGGKIKIQETEHCDIDRRGPRAFVRPFAQKEMVDRFLYGLDDELRDKINKFCEESIGKISEGIFDRLEIQNATERDELIQSAREAEAVFLRNLSDQAFRSIQDASRREIEDMVEFMPKPELAKMAEALIDLTSIKRKVSRGLETVGGPVDVAVISKGDGFVWVRRKHYFPGEINARYFERLRK